MITLNMEAIILFKLCANKGFGAMKLVSILAFALGIIVLSSQTNLARSADITFDASYYYYEEPNFMNDTSDPVFVSLGLRDWETPIKPDTPWQFIYTTEITRGWVKYSGSGTLDKDYYKFRGEAYAGYKIDKFTPFIGLGYRWLYDDSGGQTSSTGALAYDRQSQYLYLPAGAIFEFGENFMVKGQFNLLLAGRQTSYLSDIAGFSDVENDQTSGWGVDITLDYKLNEKVSLYSFYRYWDIDKSDIGTGTFAGVLQFEAFEPANTTTEVGIGISYKF
jgi:opacity protein-like surface antigen